uniref:primosomal protein n=1 Tax=Microbacterium sp. TaxID=51671 RepID=UPI00333FDE4F
ERRPQGGDRPYRDRNSSGERRPYGDRDGGERRPYGNDRGDRPYRDRNSSGERRPQGGDRPYRDRNSSGERRPYGDRDGGERRPYGNDRGDRPYRDRNSSGERRPQGGDRPYRDRNDSGARRSSGSREGRDRRSFGDDRGDRPYRDDRGRSGDRGRPQRGGSDRPYNEFAPVRPRIQDPALPDEVTPRDLHPAARNELKTLSKENAERVARHLAMAADLIDDDPALAHEHALAASRHAGRIAIVRETLAITAYGVGDFALALRELRTYRRISGKDDQIALLVDSERGVGRPDRALEEGRAVDRSALPVDVRVALAIAMSGARLDRGETELALGELEIPELDPDRAFDWSPALFAARAAVLEDLGRSDEAAFWHERAEVAAEALGATAAEHDELIVEDGLIESFDDEDADGSEDDAETEDATADADSSDADDEDADAPGAEENDADAGEDGDAEGIGVEPEGEGPAAPDAGRAE